MTRWLTHVLAVVLAATALPIAAEVRVVATRPALGRRSFDHRQIIPSQRTQSGCGHSLADELSHKDVDGDWNVSIFIAWPFRY